MTHQKRIENLLFELRFALERGIITGSIDEEMLYQFYVPISFKRPDGMVLCTLRTQTVKPQAGAILARLRRVV